jgi:hypothetical protein
LRAPPSAMWPALAAPPRRRRPRPSPAATGGVPRAAASSPARSARAPVSSLRSARWRGTLPATRSRPARAALAQRPRPDRPVALGAGTCARSCVERSASAASPHQRAG